MTTKQIINSKNLSGWTALHQAARGRDASYIKFLIERGADVNAKDEAGDTPLIIAMIYGTKDTVECLLDAGADPNIRNELWRTPIFYCLDDEVAELLVEHGANLFIEDKEGSSILQSGCTVYLKKELIRQFEENDSN